jgi:hypothetical protein
MLHKILYLHIPPSERIHGEQKIFLEQIVYVQLSMQQIFLAITNGVIIKKYKQGRVGRGTP